MCPSLALHPHRVVLCVITEGKGRADTVTPCDRRVPYPTKVQGGSVISGMMIWKSCRSERRVGRANASISRKV
ncbi:hypothetical protein BJ965_003376 [Streptomyces luteogriseus]|uniref:Uncharacterized protein n=1 Tax=Streptomyces luteogriseus TaxID=68233 RepID=A0A7W7GHQ8_9ACTN|nr:hypothetical protein [Streptomyces luteogriseus]